jgi:hypothetical protein
MEAVLSLYEKREQVNLGGVQFPLSLRLNSLGYRFYSQIIHPAQSEYHFRIPTTDRSVRAVGWWIQNQAERDVGRMYTDFPVICNKLETKIGTEIIHPCIQDNDAFSSNVSNFLANNFKKCASLFSPCPQYLEGNHPVDKSQDVRCSLDNQNGVVTLGQEYIEEAPANANPANAGGSATMSGCVSFENLDRREGDYQGSYQASGKDLTNVGSIEMTMRFGKINTNPQGAFFTGAVVDQDYINDHLRIDPPSSTSDITFIVVYDNVLECSPQGIMDVTNAVL